MRHSLFASAVGLMVFSTVMPTDADAEPGYFVGPDGSIISTDQAGASAPSIESQIFSTPNDFSLSVAKPPLALGAAPMAAAPAVQTGFGTQGYQIGSDGTIIEMGGANTSYGNASFGAAVSAPVAFEQSLPMETLAPAAEYGMMAEQTVTMEAVAAPAPNYADYVVDASPTYSEQAEIGSDYVSSVPYVASEPVAEYASQEADFLTATMDALAPLAPELGFGATELPLETTSAGARYDLTAQSGFDYGAPQSVSAPVQMVAQPAPMAVSHSVEAADERGSFGPVYDEGPMSGMDHAMRGDGGYGQATVTASSESAAAQSVRGWVGRSSVVNLQAEAAEIIVSDPNIARVILRTARQSVIVGLKPGNTDVSYFDEGGNLISVIDLSVSYDLRALEATLSRIYPNVPVALNTMPSGELVVEAVASSPSEAAGIRTTVERYLAAAASASGLEFDQSAFVDRVRVATDDQVLVKVRIAEMRRSVIKQFGVDFNAMSSSGLLGGTYTKALSISNGFGANGSVLGGIAAQIAGQFEGADISGLAQAFEQHNVMRVLAEPTLTAVSGETASFLAGGEFPYPTSIDDDTIGVTYRTFGVALEFTPVVLDGGRISMSVATEISELSNEGALNIGGITIPGIAIRRANTTVELPSGGTMSIAGLLQQRDVASHAGLPGIKNVPVVGQLFSSTDYLKSESELVILVTPYLVRPRQEREFRLPTDGFEPANDFDLFLLGRLQKVYGAGAQSVPGHAARTALKSPLGFIVN